MKKIACVVGARPQFIKHFPLEIKLKEQFQVISIHTGQHYDDKMSRVFFDELKIDKPSYQLSLTKSSHGGQTGEMLFMIEEILLKEQPDAMLVYGDTNSTIAGALAAAKLNIPVIHVEAGLRSYNRSMPEEVNRIMTDHISSLLFCSSEVGVLNLEKEGVRSGVHICGDLMRDALQILHDSLQQIEAAPYFFATFHRPYNTDDFSRMNRIIHELNALGKAVIFPVHPRTRKILLSNGMDFSAFNNIRFIEPVGYIDSLQYQRFSDCVITDSGGIQKEAYWLKRKCITVRSETEWIETLTGGWNTLVFHELSDFKSVLSATPDINQFDETLYGDGYAASSITDHINTYFHDQLQ